MTASYREPKRAALLASCRVHAYSMLASRAQIFPQKKKRDLHNYQQAGKKKVYPSLDIRRNRWVVPPAGVAPSREEPLKPLFTALALRDRAQNNGW